MLKLEDFKLGDRVELRPGIPWPGLTCCGVVTAIGHVYLELALEAIVISTRVAPCSVVRIIERNEPNDNNCTH